MNLLYGIYIGHVRPFKSKIQNYQEIVNEFFVQGCYYMLII